MKFFKRCFPVLTNPLREWYQTAEKEVNLIIGSLTLEFVSQFNLMRKNLEEKTSGMKDGIEQAQKTLEVLFHVFNQMSGEIQPQLDHILELEGAGDSPLKGDLFEGLLETQEGGNGNIYATRKRSPVISAVNQ